jgi:hypothetical protein
MLLQPPTTITADRYLDIIILRIVTEYRNQPKHCAWSTRLDSTQEWRRVHVPVHVRVRRVVCCKTRINAERDDRLILILIQLLIPSTFRWIVTNRG